MSQWIDITRTLSKGIIQWPGDPPFDCREVSEIIGPASCMVSKIETCAHVGTHIDAPLHFIKGGMDIAEVPLSKLCGRVVVVEVPSPEDIGIQQLENAGITPGHGVLFKTLNQQLWDKPEFDKNYVGITSDAAIWLVDHQIPLVGVDYLSVDRWENTNMPVHQALLGNGVIIIEGLDLSETSPGEYELAALPLKIAGCEAAPARVIVRKLRGKSGA
ncbi:MAG: cyclase family protein [Planctomycetota bacterium]|jgi:arylformamidase